MSRPAQPREIRVEGPVAYVPLTRGYTAIVDTADLPLVEDTLWITSLNRPGATGYAVGFVAGKHVKMHRLLLDAAPGQIADHVNGNGLDNRRSNLRFTTAHGNAQNARRRVDNTSGAKGVNWSREKGMWHARIQFGGRRIHLGFYEDREEAIRVVADAREIAHGAFGRFA